MFPIIIKDIHVMKHKVFTHQISYSNFSFYSSINKEQQIGMITCMSLQMYQYIPNVQFNLDATIVNLFVTYSICLLYQYGLKGLQRLLLINHNLHMTSVIMS